MNLFSLNCVSESILYFLSICKILFWVEFNNSFHNWFYNLFYLFVWVGNLVQLFFYQTTDLEFRNDLIDKWMFNNRRAIHMNFRRGSPCINLIGSRTTRPHLYLFNMVETLIYWSEKNNFILYLKYDNFQVFNIFLIRNSYL